MPKLKTTARRKPVPRTYEKEYPLTRRAAEKRAYQAGYAAGWFDHKRGLSFDDDPAAQVRTEDTTYAEV
jgi:hypothetical protein